MQRHFVFSSAPFRQAHASTIAETRDGLVAAWFGGTREGHADVGIWLARRWHHHWSEPEPVADGVLSRLRRYPCWNPVLFPIPRGPLLLFYKVGPSPSRWWGLVRRSADGGRSWSPAKRLPPGVFGPIKNKPILGADGLMLCPSSSEDAGWRVHSNTATTAGSIGGAAHRSTIAGSSPPSSRRCSATPAAGCRCCAARASG